MTSAPGRKRCVVIGGGGHAAMVVECLLAAGDVELVGILDPRSQASDVLGVPVIGGDELLPSLAASGVGHFAVGLGGVGDTSPRRRLFEAARSHGFEPLTVMHPSAICSRWASIGAGAQLMPASIVNARAVVGINAIVNTGAIVEHDCRIGDHAHVASGARLASTVTVGAGAHVGAGATIRQCVEIGAGSVVGAGAVVVRDVAPGVTVTGVPARPRSQQSRSSAT